MRLKQRRSVVLPQPLGPIREVMIPCRSEIVTSLSAWKLPYQRLSRRVSIAFASAVRVSGRARLGRAHPNTPAT
jgi:hypothetical protein